MLVSRLTADIQSLTTFVRLALPEIATNLILLVATLIVLVVLSPKLLLFMLISLPVVIVAWAVYHRRSEPAYLAIRDSVANTLAALQERFAGVRVIQAFRRERDAFAGYEEKSREQITAYKRASYVNIGFFPLIALAQAMALAGVLVGGAILYDRGEVTIGTVAAFVLYVAALFDPLARLAEWFSELRSGQAALTKIVGVLETPVSVPEHEEPTALPDRGEHAADEVAFAYDEGRLVLDEVAMAVSPGERVALVGPTGAGKSTFAKLLTRKYDPLGGAVAFGDIDLRSASYESLRDKIVFVPQEGHLFTGSVADNVRLARPDASDEEVREALRSIGALERFERLPGGHRHRRPLARRAPVRRRAPARLARARAARRPGGDRPRRGDVVGRPGHRASGRARAGRRRSGPHRDHHRPPAVDGRARGPGRGAPGRQARRARRARGARRARRLLRTAVAELGLEHGVAS